MQQTNGKLDFAAVPAAMRDRRQWLVWRFEQREGDKKPRKVPYYASGARRHGDQGSERDRAALVGFEEACNAVVAGGYSGIGFAFLPGDGLIGIDIDGAIDTATGEIAERAANIIQACASYTEYSPSGRGVHIIVAGETETFKSNAIGLEVFCGRQFFTVTGVPYPGAPPDVRPIDEKVLARLKRTVDAAKGRTRSSPAPAPAEVDGRAKVESALAFISADCGYEEWIEIGMAIHAELGSGAFAVWDTWSAKSAKYPGSKALQGHWRSFEPGGGITGATIFKRAMEAGWRPPRAERKRGQNDPPLPDDKGAYTPRPAGAGEEAIGDDWRAGLLSKRGEIVACLANVFDILSHSPEWAGVVAFDEFAQRTVKLKAPPFAGGVVGEWDSSDDSQTAMWITRAFGVTPSSAMVAEAIEVLARANPIHPVRDWLKCLPPWDGVPRLDDWLTDFLGVAKSEYIMRVGRFFLLGMIARVMRPGVKFDYCLVLEGRQGKGKSSALALLGGEWFGDTDLDLHNKDSMSALRGKWLYEFAELGSVTRAEASKQKSFLSRQIDEFRPVYGRREIRCPRQVVFAGSTNDWEWNKDPTGGRRFWPVDCEEDIDLEGLRAVREQLFAEALHRFEANERFWPTPEEQRELFDPEQLKREQQESLIDALHDWVYVQVADFSVADAAIKGLDLDASKLTRDLQTRIGIALRKLGCTKVEKRNGMIRYWYQPPARNAETSTMDMPAQRSMEANDEPF